ncbi:MAG: glycine zipper family protein [Solirubrobacteraceae bacterium MAG38_C4-C5]|nr:glycine zipper family protein [Candidatus Siliceabacter maunaloa]
MADGSTTPRDSGDAQGVPIGSFSAYDDAVAAVDRLAAAGFPVESIAIVGRDLRMVEDVTGAATASQSAARGAGTGALIGALVGWLLGVVGAVDPLVSGLLLALYGLVIGAALGALWGVAGHLLHLRRHDFSSVGTMCVGRYEVVADAEVAERASALLAPDG